MRKYFSIDMIGVKCDTPYCNFRDDSVKSKDYHKWLGIKCPVCGSVIITQEEINDLNMFKKISKILNIIFNIFKFINPMFYYNLLMGKKSNIVTYVDNSKMKR